MRFTLAAALTLAAACSGTAFCDTINFTGSNAALGHSQMYSSGSSTVTAYAFANGGGSLNLYGKNGGGAENGVGISGTRDNEITTTTFIQLDVSALTNPFALSIGSTQNIEGFNICFSNTLGVKGSTCTDFPVPGSDPRLTGLFTAPLGDRFVSIQADGGVESLNNVLLDSLVTTATPEPSSLMLLGTGILGAAGVIRRKLGA